MNQLYFSADYTECRHKFLSIARRCGARLESFVHPDLTGPLGETLAMDVAAFGAPGAPKMFFNLVGTHGVEGYPGSAAMLQLMESGLIASLPKDIGVVLLHGHNPYGWSIDSQLNEDLVDLNRNFIDHAHPPACDREVFDLIATSPTPEQLTWSGVEELLATLFSVKERFGATRFMNAINGQYEYPELLKFGGQSPCWSNTQLRAIARQFLGHAREVAYLDWHTGLGARGKLFEICDFDKDSAEYAATHAYWGERIHAADGGWHADDPADAEPMPDGLTGLTLRGVVESVPEGTVGGGVVEFGTVPFDQIARGALIDRWIRVTAPKTGGDTAPWRALVRTLFAPQQMDWQSSCLVEADKIYQRMFEGLIAR